MIGERGRILTRPLTREEQKLCEDHHHIIYEVMRRYRFTDPGLDVYGEFALALMDAAQNIPPVSVCASSAFRRLLINRFAIGFQVSILNQIIIQ